ncbi:MAG TPA: hypothetical protein VE684_06225 [Crenalkalicoccus sp.]|nr:hypothetical protein [Crenalkalicoccus sp.]
MFRLSLLIMLGLTVLIAIGLRWREERMAMLRPAPRRGWVAQQKHMLNRWVTAAAIAVIATLLVLGGLNWLRILES